MKWFSSQGSFVSFGGCRSLCCNTIGYTVVATELFLTCTVLADFQNNPADRSICSSLFRALQDVRIASENHETKYKMCDELFCEESVDKQALMFSQFWNS